MEATTLRAWAPPGSLVRPATLRRASHAAGDAQCLSLSLRPVANAAPRLPRRDKPILGGFGVGGERAFSFGSLASGAVVVGGNAEFDLAQTAGSGEGASPEDFAGDEAREADSNDVATEDEEQKRVMCLMSDTGGGHRASAQALRDGFETLYGNKYDIKVVDLWTSSSPWPLCNMPKSYFFLVKNPWLWRLSFRSSEPKILHEAMFTGYTAIVGRRFAQAFQEYKPNLIVSVHPLMQHVPLKVLARMKTQPSFAASRVPFATVVTDLTRCHRTWFHKQVDRCFVATQLVAAQAMRCGLKAKQLSCHGLPIRPAFNAAPRPKAEIRAELGMDETAHTVMLVGGGEGMGKLEQIAEALEGRLDPNDQIVLICGKNQKLAAKLEARGWRCKVCVRGFVTNMADYMSACDCIITKAGPGTIAEALICGLPIMLNGFIPCQEAGNVSYVLENGVGAYDEDPEAMARIVAGWFALDGEVLEEMSKKARMLGRPEATFNIVRDLAGMACGA